TAAALLGASLALYHLFRERRQEHLLVLLWVGLAFLYFGGQTVKYMRYLLPIYPFLALLAAYLLVWLFKGLRQRVQWRRAYPIAYSLCLITVLLGTFLWAWAFTRIYTRPLTRVEASSWIYQNVPPGTVVAVEHWDDPLPLTLKGQDPQQYRQLTLELYNDDNPAKLNTLVDQLAQADYIFVSSNRLYGSIPRLPLRYPMTSEYYRLLFSGQLGFQQVQTFTSYPNLGPLELVDDTADESFTVYDHPKVLIFKKTDSFSRELARQLLSAVSLDNVIRQGPKDAATNALLMPPDLLQANRSGGTWTDVFDPGGLPSQFPFLTWYLLVQALSVAALPLGVLALGRLPDRGYPLFKTLGILLLAYLSWLAASLRLLPYTRATILAAFVLMALLSALLFRRYWGRIRAAIRDQWRLVLVTEVLFLAAFAAFYLIRMADPDLWHAFRGGEKPMDLAYLNAVTKSTYFPPYDPWFSGGYINYYYFGQVLVATLTKLTAIPTTVTYNMAVPLFFALTVLGAFSGGYNLLAMTKQRQRPFLLAIAGGLAAALLVAVVGNLDGFSQLVQGFWQINPHPFESPWPGVSGLVNAWLGLGEALGGKSLPVFDYWRSSRAMPPSFSITEFPYFTFLFADLHPHLIVLPFTLLALGFIFSLVQGSGEGRAARIAQALLFPLSLGALWVINSWDFPTYFLLAGAVLLLVQVWSGFTWPALGRAVLLVVGLFLGAYLLYYPFHYYYQQFYAGVNPSPEKTPIHQYLGVHGLFILIIGAYLLT
ncbi:MAG: DUF2298 domain-containing protein, partial [Dehalococcoidia bacterium]|nr:DUF2298 domain-containing protein [Dehalococcoidia bacterium]